MRYSDAATAYEAALKIEGDRADIQRRLASVYLDGGEVQKAADAFKKIAGMDPQGRYFNDVAYRMANADLRLPMALEYARKAVQGGEEESQKIRRANLKLEAARSLCRLVAYSRTPG